MAIGQVHTSTAGGREQWAGTCHTRLRASGHLGAENGIGVRMSQDQAPVIQRALLTSELRRLRAAKEMSQEEVAKALDWSLSKLIRIEGGGVGLRTTDLKALLELYGVIDKKQVNELAELAKAARERGWWTTYKNVRDQEYLNYIGYETGASIIRQAQGLLVPGLLQTEEYAGAITREYIGESSDLVKDLVDLRLERQEQLLGREKPPQQFYVLDEAVIRRRVGGAENPDLMPAQLRHLVELSNRPDVTIEVIPFEAGAHFGLKGPFTLLEFESALGDVLYLESARRGDLTRGDPASIPLITEYHEAFERLRNLSLEPQDSAEFISGVAGEMSRHEPTRARRKGLEDS